MREPRRCLPTRRICLGQPRDGSLKRSRGSQVASKAAGRPGGGAAAGDRWDGRGRGNPQVAGACSSLGQLHVLAQDYGQRAGVCHAG